MKRLLIVVILLFACGSGNRPATGSAQQEPAAQAVELPTAEPTPDLSFPAIELSGSGDSVVGVSKPQVPAIVEISGNVEGRHFSVKSLNASGEMLDLLVNTTDPYHGIRPLDFAGAELTTRLEVTATGDWSATIRPITDARHFEVPGSFAGSGDDILFLTGSMPDIATISGNQDSRHFSVIAYGGGRNLLVNTTDPYQGQVIVPGETIVLGITAVGDWSIDLTTK